MKENEMTIRDDRPASDWAEAYPVGNGRIGAMIYGDPGVEHIALNHDLLWRSYLAPARYGTCRDMEEIKALCREKRWYEANEVFARTIPRNNAVYINPFVPACDLFVKMRLPSEKTGDYTRFLDQEHGIVGCSFENGGIRYGREGFSSVKDGVFVLHLSSSVPGMLMGEVSLSRMPDIECTVTGEAKFGLLTLDGVFDEGKHFSAAVRILHRNGRLMLGKKEYGMAGEPAPERHFGLGYVFDRDTASEPERGISVFFDSCDEVTLIAAISVDSEGVDTMPRCIRLCEKADRGYPRLLDEQKAAFSAYMDRSHLSLTKEKDDRPMRERIAEAEQTGNVSPALLEDLYLMARYLAVASGMPQKRGLYPKAPINLQGIWVRDTRPAWESDYHLDLNVEMCYWSMASAGLTEFFEPFLVWVERLLPQAEACAQDLYGCHGAAFNGCCDPWTLGLTDLVDVGWLGGGAWLAQILWIYYEYAPSESLLRRIYAILVPLARFCDEMLTEEKDGYRTYPFGASPEQRQNINGRIQHLASASACDLSLTKELFTHAEQAAEQLGYLKEAARYRALAASVHPMPISKNGELMEWSEPHREAEPGHRHRSPFICFCPGTSVTKRSDPELTAALEKLLDRRMAADGASFSFAYTWDAQILARLRRGEDALSALSSLVRYHLLSNLTVTLNDYSGKSGSTWFPGVKVVQIEAELGLISSVKELLLQDTDGILSPLPALPAALSDGIFTGVPARGGFTVDLQWNSGCLSVLRIVSERGEYCRIELPAGCIPQSPLPADAEISGGVLSFPTGTGDMIELAFRKESKS